MLAIRNIKAPTLAAAFAVALAGCASAPTENPQLSHLEAGLQTAYGNKYIAEYGQADLAKANASLVAARVALQKGHDGEFQHELAMGEGYVALGVIHGQQERTKAETAALKDQQDHMRLAARDRDVRQANDRADASRDEAAAANAATQSANDRADSARAETVVANTATQNANDRADTSQADAVAATAAKQAAEAKVAAMHVQLNMYDMKFTDRGAILVLRDVMFNVDSSLLLAGAVTRLEPLISYLRASPTTSVRIDGHTDSSGTVEHNNVLSLDRANSVRRALLTDTSISNVIETNGYGQTKPVATNATVSGREQNRRVEITLQ